MNEFVEPSYVGQSMTVCAGNDGHSDEGDLPDKECLRYKRRNKVDRL